MKIVGKKDINVEGRDNAQMTGCNLEDKVTDTLQSSNKEQEDTTEQHQSKGNIYEVNRADTSTNLATKLKNMKGIQLVVDIGMNKIVNKSTEPLIPMVVMITHRMK